jgi:hypothetical protein
MRFRYYLTDDVRNLPDRKDAFLAACCQLTVILQGIELMEESVSE